MSVRAPQPRGGGPSAPARLPGHLRRRLALALSLAFALAGGQAARAEGNVKDPGAPFPYTTVWMPRSTSMAGAHAAVATSNDAFLVNPAGLAQARRYHLEIDGALDPQFPGSGFIVTAVDASSLAPDRVALAASHESNWERSVVIPLNGAAPHASER